MDTYTFLQHYWWFLLSLLGGLLVFLFFVQGGQSLLFTLGKTETQQNMLLSSIGRKWELTFTTLVTFGGAFFASFPLFYSTSFSGAYWIWILLLLCFVIQAVSYEFQVSKGNLLGKKTYQLFLFINGIVGPILLGTIIGTFFNGARFIIHKIQLTDIAMPVITHWTTPWHGLEALFNLWNVSLGLTLFFLSRLLASLYFFNHIDHKEIRSQVQIQLFRDLMPFLVFFLVFLIHTLLQDGFAYEPLNGSIYMVSHKYLHNFLDMPILLFSFTVGVILLRYAIIRTRLTQHWLKGIWFGGIGSVLVTLSLLLCVGWNYTAYYPSISDLQSSLTIKNSSSSLFTLKVMSYVSFIIPIVLTYIFYTWRTLDRHKIKEQEVEK